MKSKSVAYLWLMLSFVGLCGFHRFYLRKYFTGIVSLFTFGLFGVLAVVDLFTLGEQVEGFNAKKELKVIRSKLAYDNR